MATVTYENHYYPEGHAFTIPGFGGVENFRTKEVDETMILEYRNQGFEFPEDGNLVIVVKEPEPDLSDPDPVQEGTLTGDELVELGRVQDMEVKGELRDEFEGGAF